MRQRRGRVSGVGQPRLRDEAQERHRWPLEVCLVCLVVLLELRVRNGCVLIRDLLGPDRQQSDGHGLVLIAIHAPQLGVGHVDVRGQILRQLHLGDLLAVSCLERAQELGVRSTREVALPLRDVELAVGLELGALHHFGGWSALRGSDQLLVRHRDPELAVLLLEQQGLGQLVHNLILDLLLLLAGESATRLAPDLLECGLPRRIVLLQAHLAAVDFENRVPAAAQDLRNLSVGEPANEGHCDDPEDGLRDRPHRAHHGTATPAS